MRKLWIVLSALLALLSLASAQPSAESWSARLVPADARSGEAAQVVLTVKIPEGWRIYGMRPVENGPVATSFELLEGPLTAMGDPIEPDPGRKFDTNFSLDVDYHEGEVAFAVPVQIKTGLSGSQEAKVKVGWMACTETMCARPEFAEIPATFTPAPGEARPDRLAAVTTVPEQPNNLSTGKDTRKGSDASAEKATDDKPVDQASAEVQKAREGGLFSYVLLAFTAGLLALITPCVFPMIPITVSFFTKNSAEPGKTNTRGALAYCLGIIVSFTGVGLLTTAIFGASGIQQLATNPFVNLFLAALFIFLALSLFGLFELTLPSGLVNRMSSKGRSGGLAGPIFMGVTFSLTTFTCTVPFVGTLLIAATQGDWLYPFFGMLAFSSAFAIPFFLLALFPQWLGKLPRSGSWLATVKAFMGFLEVAAAVKFLSNVDLVYQWGLLTRPVFLAIWFAIMAMAGFYLFGWLRLGHTEGREPIGWLRRGFAVLSLVAAGYCLAGIRGVSLGTLGSFLPPDPYPGLESGVVKKGELEWIDSYDKALAAAKAEGKPLFIDFTGVTCTNCRQMEQTIFPQPVVREQLERSVRVKLYTDRIGVDEANADLQTKLTNTKTLPVYVVMDPNTEKVISIFQGSTYDAKSFAEFIDQGIAKVEAQK